MDWLINKIKHWQYRKHGIEDGYNNTLLIYTVISTVIVLLFSWLCGCLEFGIISTICFNSLRDFSFGFHCKNLNQCILFTLLLIGIFGYISQSTLNYIELIFLIAMYCSKNIILKSPVGETDYTEYKSIDWHKEKCSHFLFCCLLSAFILLKIGAILEANCILLSLVMVDVTLFVNDFSDSSEG